jgi:outer membrane protein OmpA-like peptidoglycan-associated protein
MRRTGSMFMLACFATMCGCAANAPTELVDARLAYEHARVGPAAELAPADLHKAQQALAQAEKSFEDDSDSYRTRDLAYVAERKSEMAVVKASIAAARNAKTASEADALATQSDLLQQQKQDLGRSKSALAASEQSRVAAEQSRITAEQGRAVADKALLAEKNAREAAEARTAAARTALEKLASVKEEARGTVVTLSGSVLFRSNEAILMPGAESRLDQVIAAFATETTRHMMVEGYADSQGSNAHNLDLSQRRADAVRSYLVHKGYPAEHVSAKGMGEEHPIADNATSEGRANNRRVEIFLANADTKT